MFKLSNIFWLYGEYNDTNATVESSGKSGKGLEGEVHPEHVQKMSTGAGLKNKLKNLCQKLVSGPILLELFCQESIFMLQNAV